MKQLLNTIKISGPFAFARLGYGYVQARFLMLLAKILRPIGIKLKSSALWILKRQSSDEASVRIFEHLLINIFQRDKTVNLLVPNYLGKAFRNILPFLPKGTCIKIYQDLQQDDEFDWVIITNVMLSSIAAKLKYKIENFEIELSTMGFHLLRNKKLSGNSNVYEYIRLREEVELLSRHENGNRIIFKDDFKFCIRSRSMDAAILDEVKTEYCNWLTMKNLKFDTIIDIGAQIGGFSVYASRFLNQQGKIFSYEPEPKNFELLKENLSMNELSNIVSPQEVALSNKKGKAELSISSDNTGGNKLGVSESSSNSTVQVVTLDALEEVQGHLNGRNLLKIDVEGWEYPILKRIEPILSCFEVILGELQYSQFGSTEKSLNVLLKAGFDVETKGDNSILLFYAQRKPL